MELNYLWKSDFNLPNTFNTETFNLAIFLTRFQFTSPTDIRISIYQQISIYRLFGISIYKKKQFQFTNRLYRFSIYRSKCMKISRTQFTNLDKNSNLVEFQFTDWITESQFPDSIYRLNHRILIYRLSHRISIYRLNNKLVNTTVSKL